MSKADERHDITVKEYIASLEDDLQDDARTIAKTMQRISGEEPILYGYGTIGFGIFKYQYSSGRKGEAHTLGFYPRKGKITIYLMDGTARCSALLARLGKHTTTGSCLYIKRLSDVDTKVLEEILEHSYKHITSLAKAGPVSEIMWQKES